MPGKANDTTVARGGEAERRAADWLQAQGLRMVGRNFRVRGGEIDLIAHDGGTLVFIEVRARKNAAFGGAAASITPAKQRRIALAAQHYLQKLGGRARPCRFDCVLIEDGKIDWLRGAFTVDAA